MFASLLTFALSIQPVKAVSASAFLDSIGVNSSISVRGEVLAKTIECAKYLGVRWFRAGNESGPVMTDLLALHRQTGARLSWGLGSGGTDITKLIEMGRALAKEDALLAFEGNNEPNNWGVIYQGQKGGGDKSWKVVANVQRDLYAAVKGDPQLRKYPVWNVSEVGAQVDNVGLQFLTVPAGAGTEVPDGTKYADFANVHNYIYHPNSPGLEDNKPWKASDPSPECRVDGLYGNHGLTWGRKYKGYSVAELETLPKVTTETGCAITGPITEEIHGLNLMSLYLDQFKRGWSHTAVYLLRDRVDEGGNQQYGFYRPDYSPRKAATFLHNLTTILADSSAKANLGSLAYTIENTVPTVHDLLLQKGDGTFALVVWSERVQGVNEVVVRLGKQASSVEIYDTTVGTGPVKRIAKTDAIPLTLSDHPVVLVLH